jgi:hypothetical protein
MMGDTDDIGGTRAGKGQVRCVMKLHVALLAFPQDVRDDEQHGIQVVSEAAFLGGSDRVERALPGADNDEAASLRHYTLAKQEVTASVRSAKQLFQAHGEREAAERCQALVVQLAEDRFNLAVVGQFKRGKSTLMNAVLGRDLLPTGLLPLTSAITTLC